MVTAVFFESLKKHNINPLSLAVVTLSIILIVVFSFVLRSSFSHSDGKKKENSKAETAASPYLTTADYESAIKFELIGSDPLIDLKFIDDYVLFALTYNGDELLSAYLLDIEHDTAEQTFSVYLNEGEDYCGTTKLNNGGFAFTTTGRIIYLSKELKPQTELMLPKAGENGRYDCILSPSGERVAYINANGLYTNSIEFNDAKLLLSTKENGEQVRILRKPLWIEKGTKLLYHFEDSENIDSVGFIASAGLGDSVLSSPSVDCFAYADEKNAFFIAPDAIKIISHEDSSEKVTEISGINLDYVVSDNDGRRLIMVGRDSDTSAAKYDVLNIAEMKIATAFMLRNGVNAPCEPMALSVGGLLAAHIESDGESNTRVFVYSVREVV